MGEERVAYFVNRYPAVSHTFIRREIAAVEAAGVAVERFSIRRSPGELKDQADIAEAQRTTYLVETPKGRVFAAIFKTAIARPVAMARMMARAFTLGRRSQAGLVRHLAYAVEAVVLARMLNERGCAHVHAHFGTNAVAVCLLMRELGGPTYSFTVHGPDELDDPRGLRIGEKIAGAAFVGAISHFTRAQLMRWCEPADARKIRVVRCTIDGAYADAESQAVPDGEPVFVNVGRLSAQKGQETLIEGFARYLDRGGHGRLVIVGEGELRGQLESQIRALSIGQSVELTGSLPEAGVREQLSRAWALALPSSAEGLPMVIMEAFALGVPAVTTHVAGIPELVRDGVNGVLIPAGDPDALAGALEQIAAMNPDERAAMGRAGRDAVLAQHDARTALTGLIEALREAAG